MPGFQSDNILVNFRPNLAALCCLSAVKFPDTIRPDQFPLLVGVEAVREKNAPPSAPQIATRYNLIFPGSNYLRLSIKVEETAPSVTQEVLEKYPSGIRVNIPDFVIDTMARALLPSLRDFYASPEGQAAFEEWKRNQEHT